MFRQFFRPNVTNTIRRFCTNTNDNNSTNFFHKLGDKFEKTNLKNLCAEYYSKFDTFMETKLDITTPRGKRAFFAGILGFMATSLLHSKKVQKALKNKWQENDNYSNELRLNYMDTVIGYAQNLFVSAAGGGATALIAYYPPVALLAGFTLLPSLIHYKFLRDNIRH
jgi:hypothetical protein